jgi:hypothetical protein
MSTTEELELEAERAELDEALEELIYAWHDDRNDAGMLVDVIAPALAAIRRHAAAEALRGQAAVLRHIGNGHRISAGQFEGDAAIRFDAFAIQNSNNARRLDAAADDIIAEGWEHQCAQTTPATREDPAEGCETPVENEGDYCPRHEEGPDE